MSESRVTDIEGARQKMRIFAIAHRLAVSLNSEYVEHRRSLSNDRLKIKYLEQYKYVRPMMNLLSPRKEVQHRWGLHGESPPEPIESLGESDIEHVLGELETLEHMSHEDTPWFYRNYVDEIDRVLSGTPFERFLSPHIPMAHFESSPMSYWEFEDPECYRLGPRPRSADGEQWWGSVNLEMGARPLWRYIKSELELDTENRWYRLMPARITWSKPSGEKLDAVGRKHLLMTIQDVTDWIKFQKGYREQRISEQNHVSYFFDPATSSQIIYKGEIQERIKDDRRREGCGFLYVGSNKEGREVLQQFRKLIELSSEVASQIDDSNHSPFDILENFLCVAIRAHLLTNGYPDSIISMPKDKLLRYAAKNLTWIALTDADMARFPDTLEGPIDELILESIRLGGQTYFYLPKDLKKDIKEYQKGVFKSIHKCFQRFISKRHGISVSANIQTIRTLISICSRYYSDAHALKTVFRSSDLYGEPVQEW